MMFYRIRINMPKLQENGEFVAWLDNNIQFNITEGRAKIFTSYEEAYDQMEGDAKTDWTGILFTSGSTYFIERYEKPHGWQNHFPHLEDYVDCLCTV